MTDRLPHTRDEALDLNDTADLDIAIAWTAGRIQDHRRWISVLFLDRKEHRTSVRNAIKRGVTPYRARLHDIEDSIGAHWRLMNGERKKLAKLRIRLSARPALMADLRQSVAMTELLVNQSDDPVSAREAMLCAPLRHAAE